MVIRYTPQKYDTKSPRNKTNRIVVLAKYINRFSLAKDQNVTDSEIRKIKEEEGAEYINNTKKRLAGAANEYLKNKDPYIKDKISELLFLPTAKKVAQTMGSEVILEPSSRYLKLYCAVFDEKIDKRIEIKEEDIVSKVMDELKNYTSPSQFAEQWVIPDLENNLIKKLTLDHYKPLPEELKQRFDDALATLTKKEEKVLRLRFGLGYDNPKTEEKVSKAINLSKARVWQIEYIALRKLKNMKGNKKIEGSGNAYLSYLHYLNAPKKIQQMKGRLENKLNHLYSKTNKSGLHPSEGLLNEIIEKHKQLLAYYHSAYCVGLSLNQELSINEKKIEEEKRERARLKNELSTKVCDLNLSVRSSNCLKNAKIRTIGDLVRKTETNMGKYKDFGRGSLTEVIDVLKKRGFSFGMDI